MWRTPVASLTPAPPIVSCVVYRPLVSAGPLPLPESGGGHAATITSSFPATKSAHWALVTKEEDDSKVLLKRKVSWEEVIFKDKIFQVSQSILKEELI